MASRRYVYLASGVDDSPDRCDLCVGVRPTDQEVSGKDKLDAPKYRIGRVRHAVLNNIPILLLQISIEPERFNRSDMSELAHRLNKDFCNEKQLNVAICDDYGAAKDTYLIHDLLTHETNPGLRGFYDLNRVAGKEGISFSTQRGKGLDRPNVEAVKGSLAEWLEWTRRYRLIIATLYEADDPVETIYAFHYAVSIVTRLLAVSLSMKLLLKPLKNQLSHLSGRE